MIVLDTNVVSEVFREQPDPGVLWWLDSLTGSVAITAVTAAELLAGVRQMPAGRRQALLQADISATIDTYRSDGAVLPFDVDCAREYAEVRAQRRELGLATATADAQIAAICRAHGATLATRNAKDFVETGIALINPWLE